MILEDEHIPHAPVVFQVLDSGDEDMQHLRDVLYRQFVETQIMPWRFYDDLVGANPVHKIVKSVRTPAQIALNLEPETRIGHDSHGPSWRVRARTVLPDRKDLWQRGCLVPLAEGTQCRVSRESAETEVRRPQNLSLLNDY